MAQERGLYTGQREGPYNDDRTSSDSDFELDELREDLDTAPLTGHHAGRSTAATAFAESVDNSPWKTSWWQKRRTIVIGMTVAVCLLFISGFGWKTYSQEPPQGQSPPWYPSPKGGTTREWAESYKKAAELVSKMTLAEKVNITTGTGWSMGLAVGNTGTTNVGFPALALQDGPLGLRFADNATAFPAGVTVGATWNKKLMYQRGNAHGEEARLKGINVLLGPSVGPLGRMPAGGRNWEGFGPDPYLQGIAASQTVKGIQDQGVMATIKHFVANEQEHFRQTWAWGIPHAISSNIDDRTMHEVYAWPFADAIKAGVASVMCSYNQVNNSYACGNSKLLNGILKDEMGFQGFVMSDWLAQRSGVASALSGLDMSQPGDGLGWTDGDSLWGPHLSRAVLNGSLPVDRLNDMTVRIVASWYQLGQDDEKEFPRDGPNFSSWTDEKMGIVAPGSSTKQQQVQVNQHINVQGNHSKIARQVAAEGTVLLKNEGVLPLSRDGKMSGTKSSRKNGEKIRIGILGEDAGPGQGPNLCEDRGCNQGTLGSGWGSGAVDFPYLVSPLEALHREFKDDSVIVVSSLLNKAPAAWQLKEADVCFVFVNSDGGEGFLSWESVRGDRNDLHLQKDGDKLIKDVAGMCGDGNGATVVVVHAVGPVVMEDWIDLPGVKAVLAANLPGEESGNALADVIFGDVNPSGKLPYTIGRTLDAYGAGGQILYKPNAVVPQQNFTESLYIDYRHFDKYNIEPRFEFGFGLSYTEFKLSNIKVTEKKPKSKFPRERPEAASKPPQLSNKIPDVKEVLWPSDIRKLKKFIYPYIKSESEIHKSSYPYPDGYEVEQPPSQAGGGEGGNPDLWETHVEVSVEVKNTGGRSGQTVTQLYVSFPTMPNMDFPVRVLRGFEKFHLDEGETKTASFNLTRRDLSYWDTETQNWVMPDGEFKIAVGESSRKLYLTANW